jgi:hypothetical protein
VVLRSEAAERAEGDEGDEDEGGERSESGSDGDGGERGDGLPVTLHNEVMVLSGIHSAKFKQFLNFIFWLKF